MPSCQFRECLVGKSFLQGTYEIFCLEVFKCDFLILHPYYIYIHSLRTNYKEVIQREKPQIGFLQQTPIFQRESYLSLVRNHFNLFSIPLSLLYLERRFIPKYNPHLIKVQRVFWSLRSFGDLPREVGEAWQMQSGVLQDLESQRR